LITLHIGCTKTQIIGYNQWYQQKIYRKTNLSKNGALSNFGLFWVILAHYGLFWL